MFDTQKKILNNFYSGLFLVFIFGYIYSEVNASFIVHDDYNFFIPGQTEFLAKYYLSIGRPIAAYYLRFLNGIEFSTFTDLFYKVRIYLILLVVISAIIFNSALSNISNKRFESFCITTLIFILPQTGAQITWINVSSGIIATFLVCISIYIYSHTIKNENTKNKIIKYIFCYFFIIIANLTYPASSFLFITFLSFCVVRNRNNQNNIIYGLLVFLTILFFYYIINKYIIFDYLIKKDIYIPPFNDSNKFEIDLSIIQKLKFSVEILLPVILNLWNINVNEFISVITATILIFILLYYFLYRTYPHKSIGLLIVCFILCLIPSMAPPSPYAVYRILSPPSAVIITIIITGFNDIIQNNKLKKNLYILILIVPIIVTKTYLSSSIESGVIEYNFIKNKINEYYIKNNKLPNTILYTYEPWEIRKLSYNNNKTREEYNWIGGNNLIYAAVNSYFSEIHNEKIIVAGLPCPLNKFQTCLNNYDSFNKYALLIKVDNQTDANANSNFDLNIDMRSLFQLNLKSNSNYKSKYTIYGINDEYYYGNKSEIIKIYSNIKNTGYWIDRLFDNSIKSNDFWEVSYSILKKPTIFIETYKQIKSIEIFVDSENDIKNNKKIKSLKCNIEVNSILLDCGEFNFNEHNPYNIIQLKNINYSENYKYKLEFEGFITGSLRVYEIKINF